MKKMRNGGEGRGKRKRFHNNLNVLGKRKWGKRKLLVKI
jgi:hypothetical protein